MSEKRYNYSCDNPIKAPQRCCQHPAAWQQKGEFLMRPHSTRVPRPSSKVCPICEKSFRVKPSHYDKRTYCSRDCMAEAYRTRLAGENNPNYRDAGRKVCQTCGIEFTAYEKARKHCSFACRDNNPEYRALVRQNVKRATAAPLIKRRKRKPKPKMRQSICATCGKTFSVGDSRRKYCDECAPIFGKGGMASAISKGRLCVVCGEYFEPPNNKKTCSEECRRRHQSIRQRGNKSHLWQGGKVSEAMKIRNSLEYKMWREQVFERDDYTCALCGERGGKLSAHHIKPFSTHPKLRTEVSNGITLCWPCHASIKGMEREHEEQFINSVEAAMDMLEQVSEEKVRP